MRRDCVDRACHLFADPAHVNEQIPASESRLDALAQPLEEPDAEAPLQLAELQAHRRLRDVSPRRRSGKAASATSAKQSSCSSFSPFISMNVYTSYNLDELHPRFPRVQQTVQVGGRGRGAKQLSGETNDIAVRLCEAADIAAITAIYRYAVLTGRASFELEPPDEPEMSRRRDALLSGGHPYLVAEYRREVVGFAYAGSYRARPAYSNTVENSVYVREDWHGRGIGRLLLTALIDEASARGFRQMIAVIGDSGNAASIRLHEKLGFAHVGVLRSVGWKHERWLDTVLMQRALGPGNEAPPPEHPIRGR
jgi:L-amino acid N-acyltransferase YncA